MDKKFQVNETSTRTNKYQDSYKKDDQLKGDNFTNKNEGIFEHVDD